MTYSLYTTPFNPDNDFYSGQKCPDKCVHIKWGPLYEFRQFTHVICSDLSWGQILTLLWLAQDFNLIIDYTPAITYSKDTDTGKKGSFESDLQYVPLDFNVNHIPYIKKQNVDRAIRYDSEGVEQAKRFAYTNRAGFRPMSLMQSYFEVFVGAVTMDAFQPIKGEKRCFTMCLWLQIGMGGF